MNTARREGITKGITIGEQRGIVIGEQRGMAIGEQKGIVIGEQTALMKYVSKLFQKGKPVEEISELTDLSIEEVNNILN
jgi:predicted transposase YdaD